MYVMNMDEKQRADFDKQIDEHIRFEKLKNSDRLEDRVEAQKMINAKFKQG